MSVVELPIALRRADVLHFLGYPQGYLPSPRVGERIDPLIEEARSLARGRGTWRRLPVAEAALVGLKPVAAMSLVVGLVTAGGEIEAAASRRMARGEATAALILDACGSAAAEEAADRLGAVVVHANRSGVGASPGPLDDLPEIACRISPGYGKWPLEAQPALFSRLPHAELGVRLESSLLMVPRKSVSFAMWLGADALPVAGLSGCAHCELDPCLFRRKPRRAS